MKRLSHAETGRHAPGRSSRAVAASVLAGGVVAAAGYGGLVATVARRVVIPSRRRPADVRVVALDRARRTIMLLSTPDTVLPGVYGLWYGQRDRYLRLGEIVAQGARTVERRILTENLDRLPASGPAAFSGWYHRHPRELGIPSESIAIRTPLGPAPAWRIPPEEGRATDAVAVVVHGRGVQRAETVRALPVLRSAGYGCLVVSYRNDGEAPASADHRYGLGLTEWEDVEAAIDRAVADGARRILLMGWSMGGAIALQAADRSAHADLIEGVLLESPVVDWRPVLDFQASASRIPAPVRDGALTVLSRPWGRVLTGARRAIDLDRLDWVARAGELRHPVHILHSDDDGYVPSGASHALAAARPDLVSLDVFETARHTKLWNLDPERWTASISGWLASLGAAGPSAGRSA